MFPLRDVQQEPPSDLCRRCGGELYRHDPVLRGRGGRLCPECAKEEKKKEEEMHSHDAV